MPDPSATAAEEAPAADDRRHLGGGVLASTGSQLVVLGTTTIASVAIARILGPSGTGSIALAANFFGVALLVAGLGLKQGIVFMVGSRRWGPWQAVRDLAWPLAVQGLAGSALGLLVYALTRDSALDGIPVSGGIALALTIPLGLAWQWSWSFALARERFEAYGILQALPSVLVLVLCVALAAISGTTGAVLAFAAAQGLAGVAAIVWAVRAGRRDAGQPAAAGPARSGRIREAIRFGLQTWSSELLQFVNYRFDLFFLAAYAATASVGVYSVAGTVTAITLVLPQSLSAAAMSRAATLEGGTREGQVSAADADLSDSRAIRHTLLLLPVSAVVVSALLLVGIPLLYGPEFDDAIRLGFILLPGVLLLGLGKVFSAIVIGRGAPRYTLYNVMLTLPPTVTAYLLVIPGSGATGAAIVSSASYALTTLVGYLFFRRVTGIPARQALIPRREDLRAYPEVSALTFDYVRTLARMVRRRSG